MDIFISTLTGRQEFKELGFLRKMMHLCNKCYDRLTFICVDLLRSR